MHLSEKEKRLVERLKKQQQSLIRWRWLGLFGALLSIGVGCYGVVAVQHFLQKPELPSVLVVAVLVPTIYVLVGTGVCLAVYLSLRWSGTPETILLLRLIEESHANAA